jgi:hypothetical protein
LVKNIPLGINLLKKAKNSLNKKKIIQIDAPLSFLMDPIVSPKVKTMEGGVRACSLACNTLGVGGHVGAPGWGLGRLTSKSIIHMNLHKPNNKLVNA